MKITSFFLCVVVFVVYFCDDHIDLSFSSSWKKHRKVMAKRNIKRQTRSGRGNNIHSFEKLTKIQNTSPNQSPSFFLQTYKWAFFQFEKQSQNILTCNIAIPWYYPKKIYNQFKFSTQTKLIWIGNKISSTCTSRKSIQKYIFF
jgi:hypothetical protein